MRDFKRRIKKIKQRDKDHGIRSAAAAAVSRQRRKNERRTELEEEVEEVADVEGDVGDELAVLPVGLDGDSHVHRVRYPPSPALAISNREIGGRRWLRAVKSSIGW
ncbi:hypothetical protein BHM03_00055929 [Ensete ventricosum]|nr:hypothetical protein BHM03_00055929 [Ensete ventricosum]